MKTNNLLLCLTAAIAIVGLSSCKDELEEDLTGDLTGTVADKTTGEAVPTANVTIEPGGKSTLTGSDGNYFFEDLDPGKYTVSIDKEGYTTEQQVFNIETGKVTRGDFLIERIPAVVTVDRTVLDFGDGSEVNSLSFNIVNSGYEDLEWTIEYDCEWIKEIKDRKGILKYGKTQAIVVFIDRNLLMPGENETTVIVRSTNGSSDLRVQAVGAEREEVVVNILDIEDLTSSSVKLCGKIVNPGIPQYTARGFVYSKSPSPTESTSIEVLTAPVTEDPMFSVTVKNLEFGEKYYVKAFAENPTGTYYSSNEISFTVEGTPPSVEMLAVSNIDIENLSAVLNARVLSVGDPEYTGRGFVYGTESNPDIQSGLVIAGGSGTGTFNAKIGNLEYDRTYFVRAFVENAAGTFFSQNEVSFTVESSSPVVSVQDVTEINVSENSAVFNGSIESAGFPPFVKKGFVYGTLTNPTVEDAFVEVAGTGVGAFSAKISELKEGLQYYVRTYAESPGGEITYSDGEVTFALDAVLPKVTVKEVTDIDVSTMTAILNGEISEIGDPPYTEKGFVYGKMPNPTIEDNILKVAGTAAGSFDARISNVEAFTNYYVRAYAKARETVVYSPEQVTFTIETESPEVTVSSAGNINLQSRTAVLNGTVVKSGKPEYYERGFVYGKFSKPTVDDNLVIASGTGLGPYRAEIDGLELNSEYFVRAYAASTAGTVYSENEISFNTMPELPVVSVQQAGNIDIAGRSVILNGTVIDSGNPSYSERGFVYGFNEDPTIYDNKIIVEGTGTGLFSTKVSGLLLDRKYYVRSYAINEGGVAYSNSNVSFTLSVTPAEISVLPVIGIDYMARTAVFRGSVASAGNPAYTEKGFVWGISSENPELCTDKVAVPGSGSGNFSITVSDLTTDKNYYVWAYVVNDGQTFYSNTFESFIVNPSAGSVKTFDPMNVDMASGDALLYGEVTYAGAPAYTERGFVYNTSGNPTINDEKVVVAGDGENLFSVNAVSLPVSEVCYIRAYAKSDEWTVYGEQVAISQDIIILQSSGIAVQSSDIGIGDYYSMSSACKGSRLGGYDDWRLPDDEELSILYAQRDLIGGFTVDPEDSGHVYWSSQYSDGGHYAIDFSTGQKAGQNTGRQFSARAVRTLILPPLQ